MQKTLSPATRVGFAALLFVLLQQAGMAQATKVSAKRLHTMPDGYTNWWSPEARTFAVYNGDVLLYDAATTKVRAVIKTSGAPLPKALSFTPDGSVLILLSDRVRLYDVTDGRLLRQFGEGTEPINGYETKFKPETVSVLNSSTGQYEDEYKSPDNYEMTVELPTVYISDRVTSPDGKSLLVRARKDEEAQVYNLETGELKFTLEPFVEAGKKRRGGGGGALGEFSADGRFIVTSHADRAPRLWNAATGALIANLAPQTDTVYGVRFSPDSKLVATANFDGIVKIWDVATGTLRHTVGSKKDQHYFAVWNPKDNSFVTKSIKKGKGEVNIWDALTGVLVAKLDNQATKEKFEDDLTFDYSPDGKMLLTKASNYSNALSPILPNKKLRAIAHLWDARTGSLIASLRDDKARDGDAYLYDRFFWSPAGDFLITTGAAVRLWNRRGELLQELDNNAVVTASFSPDGRFLALTDALKLGATVKGVAGIFIGKKPTALLSKTHLWQIESAGADSVSRRESAVQP
jgi:WD40 repeat protein